MGISFIIFPCGFRIFLVGAFGVFRIGVVAVAFCVIGITCTTALLLFHGRAVTTMLGITACMVLWHCRRITTMLFLYGRCTAISMLLGDIPTTVVFLNYRCTTTVVFLNHRSTATVVFLNYGCPTTDVFVTTRVTATYFRMAVDARVMADIVRLIGQIGRITMGRTCEVRSVFALDRREVRRITT